MITSDPFLAAASGQCRMQLMEMVIDGLEFARRGGRADGRVQVAYLLRVADYLASSAGTLECVVQGGRNEGDGHYELKIAVSGELQLQCQRCLEGMSFPLQLRRRLRLIAVGVEWPDEAVEEDEFDAIEASGEMAVGSLIEDEVLLALPLAPRHDVCGIPRIKDTKQDASPFAVLRDLKVD